MSATKTFCGTKKVHAQDQNRGTWMFSADRDDIISILDNAPYGIVINSGRGDGDVLYINHEIINLMGYVVPEIPDGRTAQSRLLGHRDHVQQSEQFEAALRETGKAFAKKQIVTKSGEAKHFEVRTVSLPSGNVVSMLNDVTRRETAEKKLRESELKFRTLFEKSSDAAVLFRDGRIFACNSAAAMIFRAGDTKRLLHLSLDQLSPEKQADGRLSSACAKEVLTRADKENSLRFEWELKCFEGSVFQAEITVTRIQLDGNWVLHVVIREITARKRAEQALLHARDRLEDLVHERTKELKSTNQQLRREIDRRKCTESKLERSREELRLLSEHLQRAREEERAQIAREIHDELGQFLSVLKIDVSCLGKSAPISSVDLLKQTHDMEQRIDAAIQSVRHICSELRPPVLEHFGLSATIEWYLSDFRKRTGMRCSGDIDPDLSGMDKQRQLMLFRVFQEAMTNILRHAEATRIDVKLKTVSGVLTLSIKDDGKGITRKQMENPRSFGIRGIRERVRYWGGSASFQGVKNQGTTITVTIPHTEKRGPAT